MAEQVWSQLQPLATPGGDTEATRQALDKSHDAFRDLHAEAEAIAQSAVTAARRRAAKARPATAAPPSLRVRIARRVPKRYRKRARHALRRLRGPRS
jgi:hypothetical protein